MIEEAIVHVGMHKTGSSSIQDTLSQITMPEVEYLSLNSPNHSGFLATLLSDAPQKHHSHSRNARSVEQVQALKDAYTRKFHHALKTVKKPRVLISAEYLSRPTEKLDELKKLQNILLKYCRRIRVIGYVRPPYGYIQSDFQQQLKGGGSLDLNDLKIYPHYRRRFEKMDIVFGKENVELITFKSEMLHNNDVVQDFVRRVGIKLGANQIVRTNESISLEATSILYVFRRFGRKVAGYEGFNHDNSLLIETLSKVGNQKLLLSGSLLAPELKDKQSDINWVSERLGASILDEPTLSENAIHSEQDLLKVAYDSRKTIWELYNKNMLLEANDARLAQLVDWLYTLNARNYLLLQAPEFSLFTASELKTITNSNGDPVAILSILSKALDKLDEEVAFESVSKALKRAKHLFNKVSGL